MKNKMIYQDAFDLLGMQPRFDINLKELEKNYLASQTQCNPDRFFPQSAAQQMAKKQTLSVNRAYVQMSCPVSRLILLLQRLHVALPSHGAAAFLHLAHTSAENWSDKISMGQVVKVQQELLEALGKSYAAAIQGWQDASGEALVHAYQEMNTWTRLAQNLHIDWHEKNVQENVHRLYGQTAVAVA